MIDADDPGTWLTLTQMREEMAKSKPNKWRHSQLFEDVEVAIDFHMVISQYWQVPERDRAYMIARKRAKGTMEAWEHHLHEKKMEEINRKNKPKGKP